MNRRHFLASLLAAPVVASLPDIRRPRFFSGGTVGAITYRLADTCSQISPETAEAWAATKALRIAQASIDTAAKVSAILARRSPLPFGPSEMIDANAAAWHGYVEVRAIAREAPPWHHDDAVREIR